MSAKIACIAALVSGVASVRLAHAEAPTEPSVVNDVPPRSTANPDVDPWISRPFVLEGQLGIGAPLGFLGLAVDYSPLPEVGLNLGVGIDRAGPQFAFSARVRVIRFADHGGAVNRVALYLGAGASMGRYDSPVPDWLPDFPVDGSQTFPDPNPPHDHWARAFWANPEAGFDLRLGPQVSLRIFGGASFLLNRTPSLVVTGYSVRPLDVTDTWLPYVGLALGAAL